MASEWKRGPLVSIARGSGRWAEESRATRLEAMRILNSIYPMSAAFRHTMPWNRLHDAVEQSRALDVSPPHRSEMFDVIDRLSAAAAPYPSDAEAASRLVRSLGADHQRTARCVFVDALERASEFSGNNPRDAKALVHDERTGLGLPHGDALASLVKETFPDVKPYSALDPYWISTTHALGALPRFIAGYTGCSWRFVQLVYDDGLPKVRRKVRDEGAKYSQLWKENMLDTSVKLLQQEGRSPGCLYRLAHTNNLSGVLRFKQATLERLDDGVLAMHNAVLTAEQWRARDRVSAQRVRSTGTGSRLVIYSGERGEFMSAEEVEFDHNTNTTYAYFDRDGDIEKFSRRAADAAILASGKLVNEVYVIGHGRSRRAASMGDVNLVAPGPVQVDEILVADFTSALARGLAGRITDDCMLSMFHCGVDSPYYQAAANGFGHTVRHKPLEDVWTNGFTDTHVAVGPEMRIRQLVPWEFAYPDLAI